MATSFYHWNALTLLLLISSRLQAIDLPSARQNDDDSNPFGIIQNGPHATAAAAAAIGTPPPTQAPPTSAPTPAPTSTPAPSLAPVVAAADANTDNPFAVTGPTQDNNVASSTTPTPTTPAAPPTDPTNAPTKPPEASATSDNDNPFGMMVPGHSGDQSPFSSTTISTDGTHSVSSPTTTTTTTINNNNNNHNGGNPFGLDDGEEASSSTTSPGIDEIFDGAPPKKLRLSSTLGSHMVLQSSPASACLYGWGTPLEAIKVKINGVVDNDGIVEKDGSWTVCLTPQVAGGPNEVRR